MPNISIIGPQWSDPPTDAELKRVACELRDALHPPPQHVRRNPRASQRVHRDLMRRAAQDGESLRTLIPPY